MNSLTPEPIMASKILKGEEMSPATRTTLRTVTQYLHLLAVVLAIGSGR